MLRKVLFRRKPWVALAVGTAAVMVSAAPAGASAGSRHATASAPTQHTATVAPAASAPVSLSGWNLVIPVDSSGGNSGDATTISPAATHPPYLTQDSSGALHFWAPSDGALLGISLHARTELRGPGTFVLGQSPAGLLESTAVTQLPDNSHDIIIGQMFPTGTTPFAMLHYQSGKVYGFVHGQSSQYVLMTGIPLGATFQDSITAVGNTVTFSVTYNGQTASQNVTGDSSWIGDTMHFQAGDYQQDLQNNPSTDGGAVTFSGLCQYGVPGGPATAAGCASATNDFSLASSPSSGSVTAGSSATATVSTAVTSGSAESVSLSASGLPSGATASFSPASVNSGSSSTLTIATSSSTPAGTYPITVTGSAAPGSHTATYTLTVTTGTVANDFSVSLSPTSGSVQAGSSATTTVSTAVTSGSAESVSLSASGLPSGATASFSPASVTSGSSSTLTIATSSSTPAGTYTVTVTGSAASGSHTATYTLTVTTASSGCYPAWSASTSYVPNDLVSYGGHNYTSLYWNTDVVPGSPIAWNIWQDDGTC